MKKSAFIQVLLSGLVLFGLLSCKKSSSSSGNSNSKTIAGIVASDTSFSILDAAVIQGNLASTLSATGPFTVFAPNNSAFAASGLSAAAVSSLSPAQLDTILLYHTLSGAVMASQVPAGPDAGVATVEGDSIFVTSNSKGVFVNGIAVTTPNVMATNGVIHVLSKVLIPPSGSLVKTVEADTSLTYLVAAVVRASEGSTDVAGLLSTGGIFTVFAPTNNAFRAAGFATISAIDSASPATLTSILTYHVIGGRVFSSDLSNNEMPTMLNGETVTILLNSGAQVEGKTNTSPANIIAANIMATNGVIHKIDQVLLP
jgi:uncharacterized surface protein with fasciclin (FAS1) repeats